MRPNMEAHQDTTLFTFRIDVPAGVRSVELLGSWDNFTHSYRMERDQRRSSRQWFGIFTFKDIVCDGEKQCLSEKREGGLKMGGTYWYYYMLDGVYEYHDESKPFTTTCSLLLGECVNILEVPYEERSDDFDLEFPAPVLAPAFTMDPDARFSTPRPNKFEALARKPTSPPPSPFFSSPVTPSCEDSARSSLALSSDQSHRSFVTLDIVSRRTSYSRHGPVDRPSSSHGNARPRTADSPTSQKLRHHNLRSSRPASVARSNPATAQDNKPGFSRNDSGVAGPGLSARRDKGGSRNDVVVHVGPAEQQSEQRAEQRRKKAMAIEFEEDVQSDSGATLACWQHRECLLRKRNGLAKSEVQGLSEHDTDQTVGSWIEHTTIALLEGEYPWGVDTVSPLDLSPTSSEFTDILEGSMMLEKESSWAPWTFSDEDEPQSSDASSSFAKGSRLPCVDEESIDEEAHFEPDGPEALGEALHRCGREAVDFVKDFELPPVLTLDPRIEEIAQTLTTPGQPKEACGATAEEPMESFLNTGRFMDTFELPPLDTQIGAKDGSLLNDGSQSVYSVVTTTVDLPQLEDSAVFSPMCSSPCTASSAQSESFQFWPEQYGEDDGVAESYLDPSSSATSPGLLPTISHTRTNSWFSNSGFQGYSLPEDQYSSQATLTKIPTGTTMVRSESPPLPDKRHSTLRVNTEFESMNELLNDFSYLGDAVI